MKTITFYSYKGGVGRSLALVNIATRLAEFGKRVCVLDFDLEAPGLHLKFNLPKAAQRLIQRGIVDYVYEFSNKGFMPDGIRDYSIDLNIPRGGKPITLIPAGNSEQFDYWKKLASINWYDLIYENENGLAFFLHLKESIEQDIKPDFLLIDSRTGISEMSGITISLLADHVVIVAANNKENLGGAKKIIQSISNKTNSLFDKTPQITFVLSRIPFTDKPEDKAKEALLVSRIKREYLAPSVTEVNVIHSDRDLEENERIKIAYEKDDSTAQVSKDYLSLFETITEKDLSEVEINRFKNIRTSEQHLAIASSDVSLPLRFDHINKALQYNPENSYLYLVRAKINKELNDLPAAKEDIQRVLGSNEITNAAFILLLEILVTQKNYEEALSVIADLAEKLPSLPWFALLYRGIIYTSLKEYTNAINAFNDALNMDPESPDALAGRANVYRLRGELDAAQQDVYRALEYDSDNVGAIATLAEIFAEKGELQPFYLHLEMALKKNSDYMEKVITEDQIYRQFYNDDRFQMIMDKYDVYLF
jgi:MinD-like ATPase involved in chromosome partitioning or flagellar assembly